MLSKTSFFNVTVYKKNLTRFAPVWILYTLCLMVGVLLMYGNGGEVTEYWFAYHYSTLPELLAVVNLGYGLLAAQLLFGDLFSSRMCNALHAMPLRREGWFLTNVLSGLTMSLVPTLVMTLLALPLMADSLFTNAGEMVWLVFLGANLEYLCFFGAAVFCAMCVGTRFAMAAGYGLLNFGAYILYWLIDTIYTPMLYGVITPSALAKNLTPVDCMVDSFISTAGKYRGVFDDMGKLIAGMTDSFVISEQWWKFPAYAGVGIALAVAGLLLYRIRDLECAGSTVAFRFLIPVFEVPCAIVVAAAVPFFLEIFLGMGSRNYLMLAFGLTVGWFVGKMLTNHTTRVFQLKHWTQLGALAAVIAVTLLATRLDIFGIETWQPQLADIETVHFGTGYTSDAPYTAPGDQEAILKLQRLAVEDRLERSGTYVLEDGQPVQPAYIDRQSTYEDAFYAADVHILYTLKNGKTVERRYAIWSDQEEGDIARSLLSRWDIVNRYLTDSGGKKVEVLEQILQNFGALHINRIEDALLAPYQTEETARSLVAAIQADCAAGNMAQDPYLHNGHFRFEDARYDSGFYTAKYLYMHLESEEWGWSAEIYPDSVNTIRWLKARGLLTTQIEKENIAY